MIKNIFQNTGLLFIFYTLFSYLYALIIASYPEYGNNIYNFIQNYSDTIKKIIPMYIVMILSFYIGWKISFKKSKQYTKINFKVLKSRKIKSIGIISAIILIILSILLLYDVYGSGILYREEYHPRSLDYRALAVYKILSLFLIILIYLSKKIGSINKKILLSLIVIISLSIGSRITIVYILLLFLLYIFTANKIKFTKIIFYIFLILFLTVFIQYSRGLEENGLLGIIKYTNISEIFEIFSLISYYVTAFSAYATAGTYDSYLPRANLNDFIIMLNPLPGYFAGWYNIHLTMHVVNHVPYTSIGTIFTLGYLGIFIFYFILGIVIGYIDSYIQKLINKKIFFLPIMIWTFMLLFIIFHNQYTLRTSMRFIYYTLVIMFIVFLYKQLKKRFKKVK